MKLITRKIVGLGAVGCVGTTLGVIGASTMKKATEIYTDNKKAQWVLYGIGSAGLIILAQPLIDEVSQRITNWVFKEENKKFEEQLQKLNDDIEAILEKKKEEETE
jgi:hypothetical protein